MNDIILTLLNSEIALAAIAAIAAFLIARLFTTHPTWAPYEGLMITAIKLAEKMIPDDMPNTAMGRANAAMLEFVKQYQRVYNASPSDALLLDVRANMPLIHAELERHGNLQRKALLAETLTEKADDETAE